MRTKSLNWFITAIVAALAFSALLLLSPSNVSATSSNSPQTVAANVNVPDTLYTDISPNSITWTNYPTCQNDTNTLITVNDENGNIPGNIFIWGTALSNTLNGNSIAIGNVLWNPTSSNTAYIGNAVTTSPVNTLIVVAAPTISTPTTNSPIYLGVNVPAGTPNALYTGFIYFDIENGSIYSLQPSTNTLSVTVNVPSICYISLSANSINFGTMPSGTNTLTNWNGILDSDPGGNAQATIAVAGTNWIYSSNTAISFYVANTVYSGTNTISYSQAFPSNSLPLSSPSSAPPSTGLTIPQPTQANSITSTEIYFGLGVPGGTKVGAYTQNIIIGNMCD